MPATPAWPPESRTRLFVETPLGDGAIVRIEGAQAHYLISVMRLKAGEHVALFDDMSGEWLAAANLVGKRDVTLAVISHVKPRESVPDLILAAAPIRRARYDWVAEKACELGVARFVPVAVRRGVVDKVNLERLRAHMIEAAEQCGRTALPTLEPIVGLDAWLAALGDDRRLYFADEEGGTPMAEAFTPGPAAIPVPEPGLPGDLGPPVLPLRHPGPFVRQRHPRRP